MTVRDVRERFEATLLGKRLRSADIAHQTAPNFVALAVLASDAMSSVAYVTEEILIILNTAAIGSFTLIGFHGNGISIPIALAFDPAVHKELAVYFCDTGSKLAVRVVSAILKRGVRIKIIHIGVDARRAEPPTSDREKRCATTESSRMLGGDLCPSHVRLLCDPLLCYSRA